MRSPERVDWAVGQLQGRLLRPAWSLAGDREQAADLAQEALLRLWRAWDRLDTDPSWPYLRRIMVSVYLTGRRRRWHGEQPTDRLEWASGVNVAGQVVAEQLIAGGLATSAPRQRAAVVLRYLDDLSVEKTAELLGCGPGTVKSQTARALEHLRAVLLATTPQEQP